VNYRLQRIETFRGPVILSTNSKSAIDEACQRRLRFVIEFSSAPAEGIHDTVRHAFVSACR
jgi:hypothetical protein